MSGYRIEICPNNRAGCTATHCKKEGTKIEKGTIRQGVVVTIQEHTSFKYRHWGCVTPQVLKNWADTSEMDMELVDGYDTLPEWAQVKVHRALEQLHVDDDDWNGDLECNRYIEGKKQQGMFVKTPKKKAKKDDADDDESEASPVKKKATKKRSRTKDDDEDDEEPKPAPKKAKGRSKKATVDDDHDASPEVTAPVKKGRKAKKAKDEVDEAEPAPAPKKAKGKKTKSAPKVDFDDLQPSTADEEPAPAKKTKAKRGAAKTTNGGDKEPKAQPPKRKGRGKKAASEDD